MPTEPSRRTLLGALALGLTAPVLGTRLGGSAAHAQGAASTETARTPAVTSPAPSPSASPTLGSSDPRMADRSIGKASAKVVVQEWFSLTCTHCARFARDVFPEVKAKLIDTGRIRYVFKDFPLDQLALAAAMVARSLPPDRYEPFVLALLSSQDRWAFGKDVDPQAQLQQMAALAGMPKSAFDAAINDDTLRREILAEQDRGQNTLKIDSTPTFVFGTIVHAGEIDYATFLKQVNAAGA